MNPSDYSPEQKIDIEKRVALAKTYLESLNLQPAVIIQPVNMGDDVFGFKPIAFLQDTKYTAPLQRKDL